MKNVLLTMVLSAALVAFGASYSLAAGLPIYFVDIDPGELDLRFGYSDENQLEFDFEPANCKAVTNKNWIVAQCHVQLSAEQLRSIGGPFSRAQVYWDFQCFVGTGDDTPYDEVPTFVSHAVLTPKGNFNVVCVAATPINGG